MNRNSFFVLTLSPHQIECSAPWLFFKREPSKLTYWCIENKIQPPVGVCRNDEGESFFLLWGYDIVEGCKRLGREVTCYVMELSLWERAVVHLKAEGHLGREPSDFIYCIRFFLDRGRKDKIESILAPFLSRREIEFLLKWGHLPSSWDVLLQTKHLSLDCIDILKKFKADELEEIYPLFELLSWGRNKAMELLDGLLEISRRGNVSLSDVCRELKEICFRDLSPADKISRILEKIRNIRSPYLFRFERRLWDRLSQMRLNKGWTWNISPGFETDNLSLHVRLDKEYGVRELVKDLAGIKERWENFYKWYCGVLGGRKEIDED